LMPLLKLRSLAGEAFEARMRGAEMDHVLSFSRSFGCMVIEFMSCLRLCLPLFQN
jgi:hypothetical protein